MTFICKAKFIGDLLHRHLPRIDPFFDQLQLIIIHIIPVGHIKIAFEIGAEVIAGNIKMTCDLLHPDTLRLINMLMYIGKHIFFYLAFSFQSYAQPVKRTLL